MMRKERYRIYVRCPARGLHDSVEHYSRGCKYEAIEYVRLHVLVVDVMKKDVRVGQWA